MIRDRTIRTRDKLVGKLPITGELRAMDLAHRLSSELRAAEEKAREFEAEANYFRDRATRAEEWLVRIHTEIQQTFFQNKDQPKHPVRERKGTP